MSAGSPGVALPQRRLRFDRFGRVVATPIGKDGLLYVGNEYGTMTVLRAGRRKEVLAQIEMDAPLYSRPALNR